MKYRGSPEQNLQSMYQRVCNPLRPEQPQNFRGWAHRAQPYVPNCWPISFYPIRAIHVTCRAVGGFAVKFGNGSVENERWSVDVPETGRPTGSFARASGRSSLSKQR